MVRLPRENLAVDFLRLRQSACPMVQDADF